MQFPLCLHIKPNGIRTRHTGATRSYLTSQHIELTAREGGESVQIALNVAINAVATGKLDIKRALLYGLQTEPYTPNNLRSVLNHPLRRTMTRTTKRMTTKTLYSHTHIALIPEDAERILRCVKWRSTTKPHASRRPPEK